MSDARLTAAPVHASSAPPAGRLLGLSAAGRTLLAHPLVLWALAAVFVLRDLVLALLAPDRPDARVFVTAGHDLLFNRDHLYAAAAHSLATTGTLPVPGNGFLYPVPAALLAAPFALFPFKLGVALWSGADALALVAGLALLYRQLRPTGAARPLFWLVAAYFPPAFAEVDAGQVGGFILLLVAASLRLAPTRPALAGALAGMASAIKVYPGALVLGAGPRLRYSVGLVASAVLATVASFVPFGLAGASFYVRDVLVPATLHSRLQDCAIASVKTFYTRTLGGEAYYLPAQHGLVQVQSPLHFPQLADRLALATVVVLVGAGLWAAARSRWHPVYGLTVAFAMGAVVPAEVNPYQFLPLLPLVLVVLLKSLAAGRPWVAVGLGVCLLGFIRQPCDIAFPNLWTIAGVAMYLLSVSQAALFSKSGGDADGFEPGHPVHVGGARDLART